MKTLAELQGTIRYEQTPALFMEYLSIIADAGVIAPPSGSDIFIVEGETCVSDDFFKTVAGVYGVQLDAELNPVRVDFLAL